MQPSTGDRLSLLQVTLDILPELGHEELKELGVSVYGQRHKIIKGIARYRSTLLAATASSSTAAPISSPQPPLLSIAAAVAGGFPNSSNNTAVVAHFRGVGVHEPMPPGSDYFPAAASLETVFVNVPRDSSEFRDVDEQVRALEGPSSGSTWCKVADIGTFASQTRSNASNY